MAEADKTLLIVGGGRWARVYVSILARLDIAVSRIAVVSRHGGDPLASALSDAAAHGKSRFVRLPDLTDALARRDICGAIVVNAARDHARTAVTLLENRIPVLVEKPVALTLEEADRLVASSVAAGARLMPALVLRFCRYLRNFRDAAGEALGTVKSIYVRWSDPVGELRYGEIKAFDQSLGVVEDVAPHVATLLAAICGGVFGGIDEAEFGRGGLAVTLAGRWNDIAFNCSLERDAACRERLVVLRDAQGREARLDFAAEPGTITVGSTSHNADSEWQERPSPLMEQILQFLATITGGSRPEDHDTIRMTTAFTVRSAELVRNAQRRWLRSPAAQNPTSPERLIAMREVLAPWLVDAALVAAGDGLRLGALVQQAIEIVAGARDARSAPDLYATLGRAGVLGGD